MANAENNIKDAADKVRIRDCAQEMLDTLKRVKDEAYQGWSDETWESYYANIHNMADDIIRKAEGREDDTEDHI